MPGGVGGGAGDGSAYPIVRRLWPDSLTPAVRIGFGYPPRQLSAPVRPEIGAWFKGEDSKRPAQATLSGLLIKRACGSD